MYILILLLEWRQEEGNDSHDKNSIISNKTADGLPAHFGYLFHNSVAKSDVAHFLFNFLKDHANTHPKWR